MQSTISLGLINVFVTAMSLGSFASVSLRPTNDSQKYELYNYTYLIFVCVCVCFYEGKCTYLNFFFSLEYF